MFLEELGYDPENLCILVPRNREIDALRQCLEKAGLDFPVVLLYLPYLHRRGQYDEEQTERLLRNLVYVGITRAMDHVNVLTLESEDPILRDLSACFGE